MGTRTVLGNSFGDADNQGDLSLESLLDTGSSQRGTEELSVKIHRTRDRGAYGTKRAVALAPVSLTASETFLKTGRSRWVWPAFLGLVPPTTLVPIIENMLETNSIRGRLIAT